MVEEYITYIKEQHRAVELEHNRKKFYVPIGYTSSNIETILREAREGKRVIIYER